MMQNLRSNSNTTGAALLKINGLNLLLPQGDIRTLESASDIDFVAPALHSLGWIAYAQKRWPVYCLSEELSLMVNLPSERRACVMLAMGAGYIGLMCDDMLILKDFAAQQYEIPPVMIEPYTPILYLVTYAESIACASNAHRLTAYIGQLVLTA